MLWNHDLYPAPEHSPNPQLRVHFLCVDVPALDVPAPRSLTPGGEGTATEPGRLAVTGASEVLGGCTHLTTQPEWEGRR